MVQRTGGGFLFPCIAQVADSAGLLFAGLRRSIQHQPRDFEVAGAELVGGPRRLFGESLIPARADAKMRDKR